MRGCEAVIDLAAVEHNFHVAQRLTDPGTVHAVVKADAYGHGALPVAARLERAGCRSFCVFTLEEAAELRKAGISASILVLGPLRTRDAADEAVRLRLTLVVHDDEELELLAEVGRRRGQPVSVQLKIDTGLHRLGVPARDAPAVAERIEKQGALRLRGTFTHLASADAPDSEPTLAQLARFSRTVDRCRGVDLGELHVANSAALLAGRLSAALPAGAGSRPGLLLYGISPVTEPRQPLRPALQLNTFVASVRRLRRGDAVGYGGTWRSPGQNFIATLPVGYADAIPRAAGGRAEVLIGGRRRPIIGRVSMDSCSVDLGSQSVALGDDVVLVGHQDGESISLQELAESAGTIPHECLVHLGPRLARRWLD